MKSLDQNHTSKSSGISRESSSSGADHDSPTGSSIDNSEVFIEELRNDILGNLNDLDLNSVESFVKAEEYVSNTCDFIIQEHDHKTAVELILELLQYLNQQKYNFDEIFVGKIFNLYVEEPELALTYLTGLFNEKKFSGDVGGKLELLTRILRQAPYGLARGVPNNKISNLFSLVKDRFMDLKDKDDNPYLLNCQYNFFIDSINRQIEKDEYGLFYGSLEQTLEQSSPEMLCPSIYIKSVNGNILYTDNIDLYYSVAEEYEELNKEWANLSSEYRNTGRYPKIKTPFLSLFMIPHAVF
ncbi:hypothetical protein H6785_04105 [Candidatus Nomurabacteria bacterium]|nr:hypothetical protein [Candidatus Nomurabacteria bacterium]